MRRWRADIPSARLLSRKPARTGTGTPARAPVVGHVVGATAHDLRNQKRQKTGAPSTNRANACGEGCPNTCTSARAASPPRPNRTPQPLYRTVGPGTHRRTHVPCSGFFNPRGTGTPLPDGLALTQAHRWKHRPECSHSRHSAPPPPSPGDGRRAQPAPRPCHQRCIATILHLLSITGVARAPQRTNPRGIQELRKSRHEQLARRRTPVSGHGARSCEPPRDSPGLRDPDN